MPSTRIVTMTDRKLAKRHAATEEARRVIA
jgi:hypothetical protein